MVAEGHIEGLPGGRLDKVGSVEASEVATLYRKLEKTIIPNSIYSMSISWKL
jgi:hypothetical protein